MPLTGTLRFTRPTMSRATRRMGKGAKRRTHQKVRPNSGFSSLPLTGTLRFTRPTMSEERHVGWVKEQSDVPIKKCALTPGSTACP